MVINPMHCAQRCHASTIFGNVDTAIREKFSKELTPINAYINLKKCINISR